MNRVIQVFFSVALIILVGCGDEERGPSEPLQIEIPTLQIEVSTEEEEKSSSSGSITGRIAFTDRDDQIRAHALSSNEYVISQGTSARISGKDLAVFVDFPSNKGAYLMEGGYFQLTDVEPGTHELILMYTEDVVIVADPEGENYTKIDVPASQWTVTVEPDRNATAGLLTVPIPDLEWKSGKTGQEIVVTPKPDQPVVPTKPSTKPPTNQLIGGMASAVVVTTDKVHEQEAGAVQNGNTFTIKAGGNDIWGNADQFTFVYQEWSGDFEMIVTVNSLDRTNEWSKAGPMARQSTDPDSINVFAACRGADDLVTFQQRATHGGSSSSERFTPGGAARPITIKLTRQGDTFYGGWSKDGGKTWEKNVSNDGVTPTSVINLKMSDPILLGMAVTSHQEGVITTSEIEVVSSPFGTYSVNTEDKLTITWGDIRYFQKE